MFLWFHTPFTDCYKNRPQNRTLCLGKMPVSVSKFISAIFRNQAISVYSLMPQGDWLMRRCEGFYSLLLMTF